MDWTPRYDRLLSLLLSIHTLASPATNDRDVQFQYRPNRFSLRELFSSVPPHLDLPAGSVCVAPRITPKVYT